MNDQLSELEIKILEINNEKLSEELRDTTDRFTSKENAIRQLIEGLRTKLKRVQKRNEKLRESYEILQRERDYWEKNAKKLLMENIKLEVTIKLWKGTGV